MIHYLITESYYVQGGKTYSIPSKEDVIAKDLQTARLIIELTGITFAEIIPVRRIEVIPCKISTNFNDEVFSRGKDYFQLN